MLTPCERPGCLLHARGGLCPGHAREFVADFLRGEGWSEEAIRTAQGAHLRCNGHEDLDNPLPPQGDA